MAFLGSDLTILVWLAVKCNLREKKLISRGCKKILKFLILSIRGKRKKKIKLCKVLVLSAVNFNVLAEFTTTLFKRGLLKMYSFLTQYIVLLVLLRSHFKMNTSFAKKTNILTLL